MLNALDHAGESSDVLLAMGYDEERARGLIRVSLGRFKREQVLRFLKILESVVAAPRPHALATSAWLILP